MLCQLLLGVLLRVEEPALRKLVWASNMAGPFREGEELVQYWDVERALPNGKPDLTAPSNSWSEVRTKFVTVVDSRRELPDARGTAWVYSPRWVARSVDEYHESGVASRSLASQFKVVLPREVEAGGVMSSQGTVVKVQRGQRYLMIRGDMVKSVHEVRSLGKERVHRWRSETSPCYLSTIVERGQTVDPFTDAVVRDK